MVRQTIVSITRLLVVIVSMVLIIIFKNQSLAYANVIPTPIFATEDTTIVYEGFGANKLMYEDGGKGYLNIGYQGTTGASFEFQSLLKFELPATPQGYQVETAHLYFPVSGGNLQTGIDFSFKVSTSTDHNWTEDLVTPLTLPAPTIGSTHTRVISSNVPMLKPTLAPFDFTSYVTQQLTHPTPRATFILSAFSAEEAQSAGILNLDHYIQMNEAHVVGNQGPYLIITYSELVDIEVTGVVDGGVYNTNITPQFNMGTATLNGGPFTSGTVISQEGSYTLKVTAGSQSQTFQFRIDKTPPTGKIIVNQGNLYTNNSGVTISVTPNAGVNDITNIRYSVNGNPYTTMPYIPSFMLAIGNTNEEKTLSIKLVDAAGNESQEYQFLITLDTIVPTGSVVINNGNAYTTNPEVTLNLSLDSGVTDVVGIQFSNTNSSWSAVEAFSLTKSYTLSAGDGNKTVYVRLIDRAGNITVIQDSIYLDTTPPTGAVIVNKGIAYTNNSNVLVDITPAAGVTDIVSIRYKINGSAPITIAYTNSFTIDVGNTNEEKVITVKLIDGAGQASPEYSGTVMLDTSAPVVIGVAEGESYSSSPTITFNEGAATLNGNPFTSGMSVDANGSYVLIVTDSAGNSTIITFNINIPAPIKYSVKYDGNGASAGQAPVDSHTYDNGSNVTVSDNDGDLEKTGYTFNGWNTKADGSGINYEVNSNFNINATDVTLYALWKINSYTLSFDSNGGNVVASQNIPYNAIATEPNTPTKSGYTFGGWFNEAANINQWNFTKDVITADKTLYAKWVINNSSDNNGGGNNSTHPQDFIVSFITNGGNVLNNRTIGYNARLAELPIPTREGYTFDGWYHDVALTKKWEITTDRVTQNANLYAKWVVNTAATPTIEEEKPALPTFDDLSGHWAKEMIEQLASQGIITGYPDGSFHPNETIKRHHMALIFLRAFKFEPIREVVSFADISPSHPSYEAIMSLQQAGIVDGSNGNFYPNHPLTRAEMAKILALALDITPGGAGSFQDVPTTHWGYSYIAALAELEIILGDNGNFNPDEPVTRAQFAAMMYRALKMSK